MPRWLLLLLTGTVASTIINFLHSSEEKKIVAKSEGGTADGKKDGDETPEWAKEQEEAKKREEASATATASPSKANAGAKKRKGGKK